MCPCLICASFHPVGRSSFLDSQFLFSRVRCPIKTVVRWSSTTDHNVEGWGLGKHRVPFHRDIEHCPPSPSRGSQHEFIFLNYLTDLFQLPTIPGQPMLHVFAAFFAGRRGSSPRTTCVNRLRGAKLRMKLEMLVSILNP